MMNTVKKITVLFFLRRIGPYHHARFANAAAVVDLIAVETRATSQEYPWEFTAERNYRSAAFSSAVDREAGLRGVILSDAVRKVFETYQPTVAVTTGWADPEYHAVVLEARARNIPVVVISDSRYEDEPRKLYKELLKRFILKSYGAALVAGTASRNYMHRLGFASEAIFQPWDVVDNKYFARASNDDAIEEKYFLCVSRLVQKKNLPFLINAYARYRANGGKRELIILGSGELESQLRDQIKSLGLTDSIQLKGFVQYAELPGYFNKALCLILPSITDQWGLVVNEAMAAGLPVLVSINCGCACDLVKDETTGYTFDPLNGDDLLAKMTKVSSLTIQQWTSMADAAARHIQQLDLDNFSLGLQKACEHAIEHPVFGTFAILHKLLSR